MELQRRYKLDALVTARAVRVDDARVDLDDAANTGMRRIAGIRVRRWIVVGRVGWFVAGVSGSSVGTVVGVAVAAGASVGA